MWLNFTCKTVIFFSQKPLVGAGGDGEGGTAPNFFYRIFFLLQDKSRNLFKFVSVLLSPSVERVGVSHMRDFLKNDSVFSLKL